MVKLIMIVPDQRVGGILLLNWHFINVVTAEYEVTVGYGDRLRWITVMWWTALAYGIRFAKMVLS